MTLARGRRDRRGVRSTWIRAGLEVLAGPCRGAVDEVLADQRLRARLAEGVAAQRAEAVLVDLEVDQRVLGPLVELDLRDLARAHAGDLHVAALDEAERVVELDRELAALSSGAPDEGSRGAGAGQDEDDGEDRAPQRPAAPARVAVEVGAGLLRAAAVVAHARRRPGSGCLARFASPAAARAELRRASSYCRRERRR